MAAFNFPNSPSTNDIHNENGVSFKWNGTVWKKIGTVANQLTQLGVTGISTFSNDVSIADKIIHTGDTNTAIRFPSADTITAETGGSEKLRIDSGGRVLINRTTNNAPGGYASKLQIRDITYTASISLVRNDTGGGGPVVVFGKSRNATEGDATIVQSGDTLGALDFYGADGTDINSAGAQIIAQVDGTPGSNDMPGRLIFKTTADGANGTTERLRIDSGGNVTIGDATYGSNLGQLRIINNAASTAASLALFGYGNTNTNDSFAKIQFASQENNTGGQITAEIGALAQGTAERGANLIFKTRPDTSGSSALERLRIASDGRIFTSGRTSYSGNTTCDDLVVGDGSGHRGIAISSGSSSEGGIHFGDGESGNTSYRGILGYNHADDSMQFRTAAAERLRIDSGGKVGINEASNINGRLHVQHDGVNENILYATRYNDQSNDKPILAVTEATMTGMSSSGLVIGNHNRDIHIGPVFTSSAAVNTGLAGGIRINHTGDVSLTRGGISATPSLEIYGSGNASDATADNLTIHNWGDSDGDYWQFGSNLGLNSGGNNAKPSTTLKGAAICVDGRGGRIFLKTSPSSSSTVHEAFIMNQSGYIQTPKRPYFKANLGGSTRITSSGYVTFGSVIHNNGSHYNASDGKFTAPIAGLYWISCKINAYDRIDFTIRVNGSIVERGQYNTDNDEVGWWSNQLTTIVYMTANQYAQVHVNHLDQQSDPGDWATFMGYLIG